MVGSLAKNKGLHPQNRQQEGRKGQANPTNQGERGSHCKRKNAQDASSHDKEVSLSLQFPAAETNNSL